MDIISSLPDPILCHILSFLPIKSSLATSVLARRWRFLWMSARNLLFEDEYFCHWTEKGTSFSDMVDRVLLLHDGPIDKLSLLPFRNNVLAQPQIDSWIRTAIARKVQVLCLSYLSEIWPPQCGFNCKTLAELTLECCTISAKPGSVCLPKLKKLGLLSNDYEDDESLPNLLSGCLAVENLVVEIESDVCEMACSCLFSPTVKSLVLKFHVMCHEPDHEHKLMLDVPAVQYLRIDYDSSYIICAESLSTLVAADISFNNELLDYEDEYEYEYEDEYEEKIGRWRDTFQFLQKLSKAKSLTFKCFACIEPTLPIATSTFHDLTQLKLEADWHFLTEFLESAHKLESLTIEKVEDVYKCWREPKLLPKCMSSSLKYVYIVGFFGGDHEFDMVRYILRHAKVLERIKISADPYGYCSKQEMLKKILNFPRGSEKCRLTFTEDIVRYI